MTVKADKRLISSVRCCLLLFLLNVMTANVHSGSIEDHFTVSESSSRIVSVVCRHTVSDLSPEWSRLLFAGFIYADGISDRNEYLAVIMKESDGYTYTYTVRRTDLKAFMNERIELAGFLRCITMKKSRY